MPDVWTPFGKEGIRLVSFQGKQGKQGKQARIPSWFYAFKLWITPFGKEGWKKGSFSHYPFSYPFRGIRLVSFQGKQALIPCAARENEGAKEGIPLFPYFKIEDFNKPLWILVSFVLRIQTILSLIRDTTLLKIRGNRQQASAIISSLINAINFL